MIYLLLWIGLFPLFYVLLYSDYKNRFPFADNYKRKKNCFGFAVLWPIGLLAHILTVLQFKYWKKSEYNEYSDKLFMFFPIHSPWRD